MTVAQIVAVVLIVVGALAALYGYAAEPAPRRRVLIGGGIAAAVIGLVVYLSTT